MNCAKPITVTFKDLAEAFGTVNRQVLLLILYNYGIPGNAYELLASYLHNRQQKNKINDATSEKAEVKTDVPQGTVLGPLLYLL